MEEIDRSSSGTTVTVSGFLFIQEVRRKMVKEVTEMSCWPLRWSTPWRISSLMCMNLEMITTNE